MSSVSRLRAPAPAPASLGARLIAQSITGPLRAWLGAGNPPPRDQRSSLWFMAFLNLMGLLVLSLFTRALFDVRLRAAFTSIAPLALVAFILLCPGLYGAWVSACAWRRVRGYDWAMIPRFQ
jgi:hypothetical protein